MATKNEKELKKNKLNKIKTENEKIKNRIKKDPNQLSMPEWYKRFCEVIRQDPEQITESFAKEFWANCKDEDIYATIINNVRCFTLNQIAYIDQKEGEPFQVAYNRIKQRFNRLVNNGEMVLGVDYYNVLGGDNLSPQNNNKNNPTKPSIYITIYSIGKMLYNIKKSKELYDLFWNTMADRVNLTSLGETYMVNKKKELVDQVLGDPIKNYVDCMGWRYSSKDEMLTAEILHKLGIKFLPNSPINLPQELQLKIKERFNMFYPWQYINADFLILTEPKTIIECWGVKGNSYYDKKRVIKTYLYSELKIRLIDIEPNEPQNKLGLKNKLEKLFKDNEKRNEAM